MAGCILTTDLNADVGGVVVQIGWTDGNLSALKIIGVIMG